MLKAWFLEISSLLRLPLVSSSDGFPNGYLMRDCQMLTNRGDCDKCLEECHKENAANNYDPPCHPSCNAVRSFVLPCMDITFFPLIDQPQDRFVTNAFEMHQGASGVRTSDGIVGSFSRHFSFKKPRY